VGNFCAKKKEDNSSTLLVALLASSSSSPSAGSSNNVDNSTIVAPENLSYGTSTKFSYTVGVEITAVIPSLPTGLSIDVSNGKISETPTATLATTTYTITATNSAGSATASITISIDYVTPTISSFSPTFGVGGTIVTIFGTNFSTTASENTITFNGVATTQVTAVSATQIKATAPNTVSTGKISVTVNGKTATGNFAGTENIHRISCPTATTCYAVAQADSTSNIYFLRTTDSGTTWNSWNTCLIAGYKSSSNAKTGNPPTIAQVGSAGSYTSITCPTSTFCMAGGSSKIARSTDSSATWTTLMTSYSVRSITCPSTSTCYASSITGSNLYKTTNTSDPTPTWSSSISTINTFYYLSCSDSNNCMGVNSFGDVSKTTDGGTNWNNVTIPSATGTSTTYNSIYCSDTNTCTIVENSSTVWKTGNGGSSWTNQILARQTIYYISLALPILRLHAM
jgi:hypothetical protein